MKKTLIILLALYLLTITGCNKTSNIEQTTNDDSTVTYYKDKLKKLDKYVFEKESIK